MNTQGFQKYKPNSIVNEYATALYQKKIKDEIYISIYEYNKHNDTSKNTYEVEIQFDDNIIKNKIINIKIFRYDKLDLKQIEKDALLIINKLI